MDLTKPRIIVTEDDLREAMWETLLRSSVKSLDGEECEAMTDELMAAVREIPER